MILSHVTDLYCNMLNSTFEIINSMVNKANMLEIVALVIIQTSRA